MLHTFGWIDEIHESVEQDAVDVVVFVGLEQFVNRSETDLIAGRFEVRLLLSLGNVAFAQFPVALTNFTAFTDGRVSMEGKS